jgi:hypothetical protein
MSRLQVLPPLTLKGAPVHLLNTRQGFPSRRRCGSPAVTVTRRKGVFMLLLQMCTRVPLTEGLTNRFCGPDQLVPKVLPNGGWPLLDDSRYTAT